MSLDIVAVAGQVRQMGEDIASAQSDFRDRVRWARLQMQKHSASYGDIADAVRTFRETYSVRAAVPMEPLAARHGPLPSPQTYVVAAADGSQAEPDRHGHVSYYLINIGAALIRYGQEPSASFRSVPRLYYRHEDMMIVEERQDNWPPTQRPREAPLDDDILAMKRSVAEIEDLARLAQNVPTNIPALLLLDGTLTLFAKSTGEDAWVAEMLTQRYVRVLDEIRGLGLPVAGFISRSNATWVMDMLRVGVCPRQTEACSFCRTWTEQNKACALVGLRDRFLYDATLNEPDVLPPLRPGERSALFQVSARLYHNYGCNEPVMFYLNSGREIAQVQVPMWVARDRDMLNRVHVLVYAQCINGDGYPTVLTRAHEQALVTAADRETLDELVLKQLISLNISVPVSAKARSKQARGI